MAPTYSRDNLAALPTDDATLSTTFASPADYNAVASNDGTTVDQPGTEGYALFNWEETALGNSGTFTWKGESTKAPSESVVKIQIYKRTGTGAPVWEDVPDASNNSEDADTNFTISGTVSNLTDYKEDITNKVVLRTWQAASGWDGNPVQIMNDVILWGFFGHRAVVKTDGGSLYSILKGSCYLSADGSAPWNEQDNAGRPIDTSSIMDLDIDSAGVIQIVYLSSDNPAKVQHVTFDTGTNLWGTPVTIDTMVNDISGSHFRVCAVVDSNDDLHVLYCDGDATTVKYTNNISDDWTKTPVTLSSTAYHGSLCMDASNYPVALYSDATTGMYAALGNAVDAVNFGTPTNIGSEAGWKGSIACDGSGNIWTTWSGRTPYTAGALKASKHDVEDDWDTWAPVTVDATTENLDVNLACIGTAAYIFCTHESTGIWYWTNATGPWVSHELDFGGIMPLARWSNNNNPDYSAGIDYVFLSGDINTHTVYYNRLIL